MINPFRICSLAALALVSAGCDTREFVLPPGDAQAGAATFVELGCNSCHSVTDKIDVASVEDEAGIHVALGGTVTRVKTYADLVTSIINPSHKLSRGANHMTMTEDGQSRMPLYNDIMTVQQLVDLTAFLEQTYQVWVPPYSGYAYP